MKMVSMKIAIITNILTPYRIPLFEEMRKHVSALKVFLMTNQEENRQWELQQPRFATEVISGLHWKPPGKDISLHFNYGLIRQLRKFSPDVVLSGGFAPANLQALLYCKLHGKRYVTWGEVSKNDGIHGLSGRMLLRKIHGRLADGAIASSTEAQLAFLDYGVPSARLLNRMMPIPVESFHQHVCHFRQSEHFSTLKARFRSPILLSVGQITERKGIAELFAIYEAVLQQVPEASLIIVGDGPDREKWEQHAKQKQLRNVHVLGFVQFDQLPQYFAVADIFLFTTLRDPLGAVLIEAMAAKIPAVSSIHAAATIDLVEDGVTGFRIDPSNVNHASMVVIQALNLSSDQKRRLVADAFQRIRSVDVRPSAEAMIKFLSSLTTLKNPRKMHGEQTLAARLDNTSSPFEKNSLPSKTSNISAKLPR